jgi:hypothetical protein
MKKTALTISMFVLAILLLVPLASADTINLSLSNPVQSGVAGDVLNFTATATAIPDKQGPVFLVSDSGNVTGPSSLVIDDTPFLLNFPFEMSGGDEVTDVLFSITLPSDVIAGVYSGYFSILGGADPLSSGTLGTVDFTVNVASPSAVPEPGTWVLMITGVGMLALLVGSRRQAAFGRAA